MRFLLQGYCCFPPVYRLFWLKINYPSRLHLLSLLLEKVKSSSTYSHPTVRNRPWLSFQIWLLFSNFFLNRPRGRNRRFLAGEYTFRLFTNFFLKIDFWSWNFIFVESFWIFQIFILMLLKIFELNLTLLEQTLPFSFAVQNGFLDDHRLFFIILIKSL